MCVEACAGVECRYGARCDRGRCVCPTDCPKDSAADADVSVCGSNGQTYSSTCQLSRDACRRGIELIVVDDAQCDDAGSGSGGTNCRLVVRVKSIHFCSVPATRTGSVRAAIAVATWLSV